ncbi:MAG: ATP-binding cassette domain-containing protein [Burkholderiales bacterium]|nr:ATP-binding cassette domain-containing protein [Burkholderiales bacterium]
MHPFLEFQLQKTVAAFPRPFTLECDVRQPLQSRWCLFGESGAGKTSVLRMLAGLDVPDQGVIRFGTEVWFDSAQRIFVPAYKRSIGVVFQDYALFPHLNVHDNVAFAANRDNRADRDWLEKLMQLCHLRDLATRSIATLSGGQKQRVAVARALARRPSLLLLDEPLSALDLETRSALQDSLLAVQRETGLTMVLVSHDLAEVFKLAQTVLLIDAGRVIESGSPDEIFLRHKSAGKLNLPAQVLAIRQEEIVLILSLLVGAEVIEVIASPAQAKGLKVGDRITLSTKAFSPLFSRMDGAES